MHKVCPIGISIRDSVKENTNLFEKGDWTCEELSSDYGRASSLLDVSNSPCIASYDLENLYENCHNGTAWNRITVDTLTPGELWADISYRYSL